MPNKIISYKDLDVYQRSYNACVLLISNLLPALPKVEQYDLCDQLRRSSKAIPRLIAEGYGKKNQKKGFQKYLDDCISETNETVVGLEQSRDLYRNFINEELVNKLLNEYSIIGKQLYRLRQSWQSLRPNPAS